MFQELYVPISLTLYCKVLQQTNVYIIYRLCKVQLSNKFTNVAYVVCLRACTAYCVLLCTECVCVCEGLLLYFCFKLWRDSDIFKYIFGKSLKNQVNE